MESHLIYKLAHLFPSFTSCQIRSTPDVADTNSIHHEEIQHFPSIKPHKSSLPKPDFKTQKQSKKAALFPGSDNEGRICPPVTPISTLDSSKMKETGTENGPNVVFHQNSSSNSGLFSSSNDEKSELEAEMESFFSVSSASFESFHHGKCSINKSSEFSRCPSEVSFTSFDKLLHGNKQRISNATLTDRKSCKSRRVTQMGHHKSGQECQIQEGYSDFPAELYYSDSGRNLPKTTKPRRRTGTRRPRRMGCECSIVVDGRIHESYAVEKCSSDPASDFRESMAEMIVEKQIFGAEDLECLLQCFLSLNSRNYHRLILDVFTEICQTLFTNN